jgi:hypothetical protein
LFVKLICPDEAASSSSYYTDRHLFNAVHLTMQLQQLFFFFPSLSETLWVQQQRQVGSFFLLIALRARDATNQSSPRRMTNFKIIACYILKNNCGILVMASILSHDKPWGISSISNTYIRSIFPIMPENPLFYSSSSEVIHTRKDDSLPQYENNHRARLQPLQYAMQASARQLPSAL